MGLMASEHCGHCSGAYWMAGVVLEDIEGVSTRLVTARGNMDTW